MGHNLGVTASLGYRQARDHNNLSSGDVIVVGKAGELLDFLGICFEVHTQLGADGAYGFTRLEFVVDKIADNAVSGRSRANGSR